MQKKYVLSPRLKLCCNAAQALAKKRLITKVIRKLKNTNAVPNTPVLNKREPQLAAAK